MGFSHALRTHGGYKHARHGAPASTNAGPRPEPVARPPIRDTPDPAVIAHSHAPANPLGAARLIDQLARHIERHLDHDTDGPA